jgi:beta-glucosidase
VLEVDGALVVDNDSQWRPGDAFFSYGSEEAFGEIFLEAGQAAKLCVRYRWDSAIPFAGVRLGLYPPEPRDLWAEALTAAEASELAVVVVGLDAQWESEGADRKDFALPGAQSAFIRAVAERNPRTVVVVNAGSAVETASWADAVPAILWLGYPGQAFGAALGQVLAGEAEPQGRLAMSWPRRAEDHPTARHSRPEAGVLTYVEGRKLGYRAFPEPAFPFGFGLGYTAFTLALASLAVVERDGVEGVALTVTVQNQGERAGSTVVQCYGEGEAPEPWGPRRLLGFQRVALGPRAQATLSLFLPLARLALFDAEGERWWLPEGAYRFFLGFSSQDLAVAAPLALPAREHVPREGAA